MANHVYPKAIEKFLGSFFLSDAPLSQPVLKFYALTSDYVYDPVHEDSTDIDPGWVIGESDALSGITVVNGVFDAADMVDAFNNTPLNDVASIVCIAEWGGFGQLILYSDVWTGTTNPFSAPAQINLQWPAEGIFQLGVIAGE